MEFKLRNKGSEVLVRCIFSCFMPFFILGLLLCNSGVFASTTEDAAVLPKGISRARLIFATFSTFDKSFSASGELAPLSPLNTTLTTQKLTEAGTEESKALKQLVGVLNGVEDNLGNQLVNVNYFHDVKIKQKITVLSYDYGLSNRLSVGIGFPVVSRQYRAIFRAETVNNAKPIKEQLSKNSKIPDQLAKGLDQVSQKSFGYDFVFGDRGYDVPENFSKTELGDVEFGGKYRFFNTEKFMSAFKFSIRTPTGSGGSNVNPLDVGSGGEAWVLNPTVFQNINLNKTIALVAFLGAEYSIPYKRKMPIPRNANDELPSLLESDGQLQDTKIKKGMLLKTGLRTKINIPGNIFYVWSSYLYDKKGEDKFSGGGDLFYEGLSKDTDYDLETGTIGISFSTIDLYRKKKFAVPLKLELSHSRFLNGRNYPDVSYSLASLQVYF